MPLKLCNLVVGLAALVRVNASLRDETQHPVTLSSEENHISSHPSESYGDGGSDHNLEWPQHHGNIRCPLVFDGRVLTSFSPSSFDTNDSQFLTTGNFGKTQTFKDVVKLPRGPNARFDTVEFQPVELTITDDSIFQEQAGFRRSGLLFAGDDNSGFPGARGARTIHFSVKQDPSRALNRSHEYLSVVHETRAFDALHFTVKQGTSFGGSEVHQNTFRVLNRHQDTIFSVPVAIFPVMWQNFAVTLDFEFNTIQVYYSEHNKPLRPVTTALHNDNSGGGQFQIGFLKRPTEPGLKPPPSAGITVGKDGGFQEKGIDEGQIYGSLFVENSAHGCVSL